MITLTPFTTTTGETRLRLLTPYHPDMPARAKRLGGRWDPTTKSWHFDQRDTERLREVCREIYGIDPLAEEPIELVTVHITLAREQTDDTITPYGDTLFLFGRQIARRQHRDEPVRLGDGVVLVTGNFASSGGSRQYPNLSPLPGTVLEVRDVPRGLVEVVRKTWGDAVRIVTDALTVAVPTVVDQIRALAALLSVEERVRLGKELAGLLTPDASLPTRVSVLELHP